MSTDTALEKQDNATWCGRRVKNKVDRKIYEDDSQRKTDGYRGELQLAAFNQLVELVCKNKWPFVVTKKKTL